MSNGDNEADAPRRDARGRFAKGHSGNNKGRPPKKRWLPVPSQLSRDIVEYGMQMVTVSGPNGPRTVSKHELVIEAVFASAMKGRVGSQRYWLELTRDGLKDLVERHPGVALAEAMRQMSEDPTADPLPGLRQAVDEWIRRIKRL